MPAITCLVLLSSACAKGRPPDEPKADAGMAHADHSPKHGGVFFMAPDGWHHLEGTYPEEGLFRIHFYDDHTRPLDPRAISATVRLEDAPEESAVPLEYDAATNTLSARLGPVPALPVDLVALVTFPARDAATEAKPVLFDFRFTRVGGEPVGTSLAGSHAHAARHGGQVVEVGGHLHLELLHRGGWLMLFVLDPDEKTLPTEGMTGDVTILAEGQSPVRLELMAHGDHLMAKSPLAKDESAVIVANVRIAGSTRTGRFTIAPPKE